MLEPLGELTRAQAYDIFAHQVELLDREGVDLFVIETMTQVEELYEAAHAVKDKSTRPLIVSITFQNTPKGFKTIMGKTLEEVVRVMANTGAEAIGSNCGLDAYQMMELIKQMRTLTDRPLFAKPNAGQPELYNGKTVFKQTPDDFEKVAPMLRQYGAHIIGGCCGTTPAFIERIKKALHG